MSAIMAIASACANADNTGLSITQETQMKITVDGKEKKFATSPVIINNRVYLSLRELAEMLKINIEWKEGEQEIQIVTEKRTDGQDLLIFRENQKCGYMDKHGNIKVKAQFDFARDFVDGLAIVGNFLENAATLPTGQNIIRWGAIDSAGKSVTPIRFSQLGDFSNGLALATDGDTSESYYIDKEGNRSPQKVIGERFFTQGFAPKLLCGGASFSSPDANTKVWSYVNADGESATDKEFEEARDFEKGMAIVKSGGKYGVIDDKFSFIIDCQYDNLKMVAATRFAAKVGDKWGLIDINGKVICDFKCFDIGVYSDDVAAIRMTMDDGAYITMAGEIILDEQFSMVYPFVDGFACVVDKASGKAGVIERSGNYIIKPQYHSLIPGKCGLIKVYDQNNSVDYYYINLRNEKVLPLNNG